MNTPVRLFRPLLLACVFLMFSGCYRNENQNTVDLSVFETIHSDGEWAVLADPYVAYRDAPDPSSNVRAHGRLGDIARVTGKSLVPDVKTQTSLIWYQFEDGFVAESAVVIYPNRLQAQAAADLLQQDNQ